MMQTANKKWLISLSGLVALTALGAVLHGALRHRWGQPGELQRLGQRVEQLPQQAGPWKMHHEEELSTTVAEMLQCAGYVNRVYVNQQTGAAVQVAVVLGPTGPTAVHTPEICYSSRKFEIHAPKTVAALDDGAPSANQFWALTFRPKNELGDDLRVYYGWNAGEGWVAPNSARLAFIGKPWLCKLQLAASVPPGSKVGEGDICRQFLKDFVPVLESALSGQGS